MDVKWDENKNRQNVEKHLLDFADASEVLDAPHFVYEDNRNDYGEQRLIAVGHLRGRLVVIVYTMRQNIYRIISMRKANAREQSAYKKQLEQN